MAVDSLVVIKNGAWFSYKDYSWHGRPAALEDLRNSEELCKELEQAIGRQEE